MLVQAYPSWRFFADLLGQLDCAPGVVEGIFILAQRMVNLAEIDQRFDFPMAIVDGVQRVLGGALHSSGLRLVPLLKIDVAQVILGNSHMKIILSFLADR
jgi:hypothetical protein